MNKKMIINILGHVMQIEAILLLFPFVVGLIYKEEEAIHFLFTSFLCFLLYWFMKKVKVEKKAIYAKDGFVATSLSWILLSIMGAIPFTTANITDSYIDSLFEIVSGFTTTGSSILTNVEVLPHCFLFWRSFSHWIGGMGVLVFIMSITKLQGNDHNIHLMRAESPGPMVGKLVPKLQNTASLLYGIYAVMTVILILALILAGMPIFDSICNALGAAGTGGFSITNAGIGQYNNPIWEAILTIGMFVFGVNFNFYFYLLMFDKKSLLACDEVKWYVIIFISFTLLISINLIPYYDSILTALRHASFQVSSIITTTGYSNCDYNLWPQFSKTMLFVLMFIGACAGSTAGGVKISRWVIICNEIKNTIRRTIHPRSVNILTFERKPVEDSTVNEILVFFSCYILVFLVSIAVVSLDGFDFETVLGGVATCLGNVGPGFGLVGPMGNFSIFSDFSTIVLTLCMLFGRLEIFPMLITLIPMTYRRNTNF